MAVAVLKKSRQGLNEGRRVFGRESNGILMTPAEFDRAEFADGWRFELINGVLIVSPIPAEAEADPNDELGRLLRNYQHGHPKGAFLRCTLPERYVRTTKNRRKADRLIWVGIGRRLRRNETPTIIVEFVSGRKRDRIRDYETKRDEYLALGVKEYWIFDRFQRTFTVYSQPANDPGKRVLKESQTYRTELLPGFKLPLPQLFAAADNWPEDEDEVD